MSPKLYTRLAPCVLLWFRTGQFYPYPSGLLYWHWGSLTTVKYFWMTWTNSFEFNKDNNVSSTKPNNCMHFYGTWWRHQMETIYPLLTLCAGNSPVTGEFPAQRPVTRSFDVFSDLHLDKRLSQQSWGWWFETPSRSLWRHCNDILKNTCWKRCWPSTGMCLVICRYNGDQAPY